LFENRRPGARRRSYALLKLGFFISFHAEKYPVRLERFPIRWNHLMTRKSRKTNRVAADGAGQFQLPGPPDQAA
jgi:hypothetical protein